MRSDQLRALARKFHQIGELIDGGNATSVPANALPDR